MSYEDMMDEHAALAHEISNRDLHVEELEKRIEELEAELAEYKDTLSLVRRSKNSQYRRIEKLEAKLAEANKKGTQRGARLQIMREWMELYRCDADYLTIWDRLIGERPEAKDWFDDDGVPR